MVERKVFLAFFGFAVGDTGTEVGDTLSVLLATDSPRA